MKTSNHTGVITSWMEKRKNDFTNAFLQALAPEYDLFLPLDPSIQHQSLRVRSRRKEIQTINQDPRQTRLVLLSYVPNLLSLIQIYVVYEISHNCK